jgi:large subunit ribosomal protein L29
VTNKEIREKDTEHLMHELIEARKHLFDLRTQAVTEKLEDPTQLLKTRRTVARIKTILRERQMKTDSQSKQATAAATA